MINKKGFTIRVYGILIASGMVLLSDEIHSGRKITKFPGGGLQFGEGTTDCLKREFSEELDIDIRVDKHFYTTDFFQASVFNPQIQVMSIYYLVSSPDAGKIKTSAIVFDFDEEKEDAQSFRWVSIQKIDASLLSFPIDQKVAGMINELLQDQKYKPA